MKKLILPLILLVSSVYGADPVKSQPEILSDKEIQGKMVAVVQDVKIENMLSRTSEFTECRNKFKFDPNIKGKEKETRIKDAQECFNKKITANPGKLQQFAEDLNLQTYGLVRSKNMQDISKYLGDKMYKSLTGVDQETANREEYLKAMQFKNRTQVDQKVFVDMYMTQLSKSALYEVSRYCFEDLRKDNVPKTITNWQDHWNHEFSGNVNDLGEPKFFSTPSTSSNPADVFKAATSGLSTSQLKPVDMQPFFTFCTDNIKSLCQTYTDAITAKMDPAPTSGAKSCLVMNRLQEIRKAITNTQKVQEDFQKLSGTQLAIAFNDPVKFYQGGQDKTVDDLTNVTSMDMIKGGYKDNNLIEDCSKSPENPGCEAFLVKDDSADKVLYDTEVQRSLEKEIQLARVKELKAKGDKPLEEYLEENAYFDLLKQFKDKTLTADEVEAKVGDIFDARKKAEIATLSASLGKRQISDAEAKNSPQREKDLIRSNAEELQSERTRLAQVVLFNNIITSHLSLMKQDGKDFKEVGKNVSAWIKESKEQNSAGTFNSDLFKNIQDQTKDTGSVKENTLVGLDMIEQILGKTKAP